MTRDELIEALNLKARQLRVLRSVNAGCEATGLETAAMTMAKRRSVMHEARLAYFHAGKKKQGEVA